MVFVDFSTNCVLAAGGIDASRGAVRFAETLENIGTFHRREASMPPPTVFSNVSETDLQTAIFTVVTEVYEREACS